MLELTQRHREHILIQSSVISCPECNFHIVLFSVCTLVYADLTHLDRYHIAHHTSRYISYVFKYYFSVNLVGASPVSILQWRVTETCLKGTDKGVYLKGCWTLTMLKADLGRAGMWFQRCWWQELLSCLTCDK